MREQLARANFLREGPWISKGEKAREIISEPNVKKQTSAKQKSLSKLLGAHWKNDGFIESDGLKRDSFDEALTLYQLYELAIEAGYIETQDVCSEDVEGLKHLLWSDGARKYLELYDYYGVVCLAQRLDLDIGFEKVDLPNICKNAEGKFSSFLSQHVLWYGDDLLDGWIGFLDDYQVLKENAADKDVLFDFLSSEKKIFKSDASLWNLAIGADRFLTRLSDLFLPLSEEERVSYGLFYAYWMARFYGYDRTDKGFVRDEDQADWSVQLFESKRLKKLSDQLWSELETQAHDRGIKLKAQANLMQRIAVRNELVSGVWLKTQKHIGKFRLRRAKSNFSLRGSP